MALNISLRCPLGALGEPWGASGALSVLFGFLNQGKIFEVSEFLVNVGNFLTFETVRSAFVGLASGALGRFSLTFEDVLTFGIFANSRARRREIGDSTLLKFEKVIN